MKRYAWICAVGMACLVANSLWYYRQESLWEPANNAAVVGDTAGVEAALRSGCNVNWTPDDGESLLIVAVENNQHAVVELLLSNHADPSLHDEQGRTAKDYIGANTDPRISKALLSASAK